MTTASHSSLNLCEKVDERSPKCLGDQVPSNHTSARSVNFDCSICLELPDDPVVTMCGHLFCWPCLHRWITIQPIFQECPVCKACIKDKIIPLYGRGKVGFASTDTKMDEGFDVPRRPSAQQSYVHAADVPQSAGYQQQSFISQVTNGNRGGHSMHSVTASGLFPALFGIDMITSPEYSGGSSFGTLIAPSRSLAIGARTPQQQWLRAQQESVLYWFLFLLGCYASVWFLLF